MRFSKMAIVKRICSGEMRLIYTYIFGHCHVLLVVNLWFMPAVAALNTFELVQRRIAERHNPCYRVLSPPLKEPVFLIVIERK